MQKFDGYLFGRDQSFSGMVQFYTLEVEIMSFHKKKHSINLVQLISQNKGVKGGMLHVVLGNEACDLDSAVSALTYSYYLSKVSKRRYIFEKRLNL